MDELRYPPPESGEEILPAAPDEQLSAQARAVIQRGHAHLRAGELTEALAAYRHALELDPNSASAHQGLGLVFYKRGSFDAAEDELRQAIRQRPEGAELHYTLGLVQQDRRLFPAAIESFTRALELDPGSLRARQKRALALFQAGRLAEAAADFEQVAAAAPHHLDALYNAAVAQAALNNWPRAEEWFSRCIALDPDNAELHYRLGLAYAQDPDDLDQKAIESLQEAIRLDPQHAEARFQLGLLYAKRKRIDDQARQNALTQLETLARLEDLDTLLPDTHRVYFALATIYDDCPIYWGQALAAYERCLEIRPDFAPAYNNLGVIYQRQGRLEEALKAFREAVLCDPDYERAYHNLGRLYRQRGGDWEAELETFLEAAPELTPRIWRRITETLMDLAGQEMYEVLYDRIHKLKNLLGLTGAKARSLQRRLERQDLAAEELRTGLSELTELQTRAYEQMVDYLRVAPDLELHLELVDLNDLVRRVGQQALDHKAASDDHHLELDLDPSLPRVMADRQRVREMLLNLAINSLEAMPEGGVLRWQTRHEVARLRSSLGESQSLAVIRVSDTGVGIPAEYVHAVFAPGFTTKPQGTGLGLAMAQRVACEHGGRIVLERGETAGDGRGCTMRVELPTTLHLEAPPVSMRPRTVILEDLRELIPEEVV